MVVPQNFVGLVFLLQAGITNVLGSNVASFFGGCKQVTDPEQMQSQCTTACQAQQLFINIVHVANGQTTRPSNHFFAFTGHAYRTSCIMKNQTWGLGGGGRGL